MSKKIDRAAQGPSWTEVILGAALSLVLGVALGAVLLVFRPVAAVKEMPKEADRDKRAVYYLEGSRDAAKAKQVLAKRKTFAEGRSVAVGEDELNALASPTPAAPGSPAAKAAEKAKAPDKGKTAEKGKEAPKEAPPAAVAGGLFAVGAPNVRIRDGVMQVAMPVTINALDLGLKVVAQARGTFAKKGDGFVYEPTEFYLGSCPVQRLPFVAGYLRDKVLGAQPIPEDIKGSWAKLANVTIEGSTLKLTMP